MQPDIEASVAVLKAYNRWLDDDWGFAYPTRVFAVPFLTLSDIDAAIAELEWCPERGARVATFWLEDQRKIMVENARYLTFG